ncbi:hypothetical protein CWI38_0606p0020 [Hamiltosporidium tvaerminnensis]|uniref:Uncharacterized protein n=2 Tax=Hamiltosporidium tvaerminnensis TaxID=1176355 RepID=A0A4Q9LWX6_9MICR|nr:hypothetical protein CWI38_0606p0020 [Hamiltosporidium tvaerminnensis]
MVLNPTTTNLEPNCNQRHVFTYKKGNFINFDLLNQILQSNTNENSQQCGIIESDFELSYFLKLSKDILEISDNLNNFKFKCMLTVLKCLKAVKHKNNTLNSSIGKNIEFLSLKNLLVPNDSLALLLEKEELDGLVLHDVKTVENFRFIDECLNLNEKIDYVDFENVDIKFCRSLMLFEGLETLKLYDYKFFYISIERMKYLEDLIIPRSSYEVTEDFKDETKLHQNIFLKIKSLTEIILINCEIKYLDMDKIFELEKLETLKINNCYVHNFHSDDLICFSSRNLKYLDLEDKSVDLSDNSHFLSELNCLEYLRVSHSILPLDHLIDLNRKSHLTLKALIYEHIRLNVWDLMGIEKLEVLEKLSFQYCTFLDTDSYNFKNYYKFFHSLKILNISGAKISLQDVKYIKNFKKLKKISIVYSNMVLRLNSNLFLSLPLSELYITDQNNKLLDKQRIKDCVYEYSSLRVRM